MTFGHRFIFFFIVFILATMFHRPANAEEIYVGAYSINTDMGSCTRCGGYDKSQEAVVLGIKDGHFGVEVSVVDSNIASAVYLRSNTKFDVYLGAYLMNQDYEYHEPGFDASSVPQTVLSPFIGLDYGYFSVKYFRFSTDVDTQFTQTTGYYPHPHTGEPMRQFNVSSPVKDDITQEMIWAGIRIPL